MLGFNLAPMDRSGLEMTTTVLASKFLAFHIIGSGHSSWEDKRGAIQNDWLETSAAESRLE